MIIIDVIQLVDQLEDTLNESWRLPFSSTLLVNEEKCFRIVDQLRVSLTDAMRQPKRGKQDRGRGTYDREKEGQRAVAQADALPSAGADGRRGMSVYDQSIRELVAAAEKEAQALRDDANQYARESLGRLQEQIASLGEQVRAGIAYLDATAYGAGPVAVEANRSSIASKVESPNSSVPSRDSAASDRGRSRGLLR